MSRVVVIIDNALMRDENGAVMIFGSEQEADDFVEAIPDDVLGEDDDYYTDDLDSIEPE